MVPSMARGRAVTMMGVSRKKRKQQKASASGTAVEAATSQDDAPSISQALQEPTAAEVKLSTGASTGGSKAGQAAGVEPVFALASMELLSAPTRVGSLAAAPSYEDVRKALLGVAADEDSMVEFVQANRDLLDYRFLYRMTADLLRAENTGDQGGRACFAKRAHGRCRRPSALTRRSFRRWPKPKVALAAFLLNTCKEQPLRRRRSSKLLARPPWQSSHSGWLSSQPSLHGR